MIHFIVHIGMPKAASTAIQRSLTHNKQKLMEHARLYPDDAAGRASHISLFHSVVANEDIDHSVAWRNLKKEIENSGCKTVILSCEDFYYLRRFQIEFFNNQLIHLYKNCRSTVILLLRRQDQWIESIYNQCVKASSVRYDRGILDLLADWKHSPFALRIDERLDDWQAAFGSRELIVKNLPAPSSGIDIVTQFYGWTGATGFQPERPASGKKNASLSLESLAILRQLNAEDIRGQIRKIILKALIQSDRQRQSMGENMSASLLPDDVRQNLLLAVADGNRTIAEKHLRDGRTRLFDDTITQIGGGDEIARTALSDAQLALARRNILRAQNHELASGLSDFQTAIAILESSGRTALARGCAPLLGTSRY